MKKYLSLIFLTVFLLTSCAAKKYPLNEKISQIRENIFVYENDDFSSDAYAEIREKEKQDDGYVGEMKKYMIFRVRFKKKNFQCAEIAFETNGIKYHNSFDFSPSSSFVSCETEVSAFPESGFYAIITIDGEELPIEYVSVKKEGTKNYEEAISTCAEKEKERIDKFIADKEYEIRVRLIENGGFNFYYVGFITENTSVSFLLDAATCEILSVKEN